MNATQLREIWVSLIWKLQSKPFLWGDLNLSFLRIKKLECKMIHQMILNSKSPPLVNRLSKQDFYNFIIGELAYKMAKKLEEKSNLHYSSKSLLQNLKSGILYSKPLFQAFNTDFHKLVTVIAWFSVLSLPSHFKVSNTSYLMRLNSKLLKFSKSLSSICLNWEIMFVQDELSRATWNRS